MASFHRPSMRGVVALLAAGVTVAGLSGASLAAPGPQRGQPPPLPQVMQVKLAHAQAVLRALALADFPALEREASRLGALTGQAEWGVLKTPEYARHSQAFLRAAEGLAASARAGDLDGAALDYATLTLQCVQCHRHVKGVRAAD